MYPVIEQVKNEVANFLASSFFVSLSHETLFIYLVTMYNCNDVIINDYHEGFVERSTSAVTIDTLKAIRIRFIIREIGKYDPAMRATLLRIANERSLSKVSMSPTLVTKTFVT